MKLTLAVILLFSVVSCAKGKVAEPQEAVTPPAAQAAKEAVAEPEMKEAFDYVEVKAKVQAVNQKKRTLTLKMPDGRAETIKVGDAVKRLKEIKAGDNVVVQYYSSIAFEVRQPTEEEKKNPNKVTVTAAKAEPNMPPAMGALLRARAIMSIEAIDREAETVTVKGPAGRVVTVKARYPENLEKIKVSDVVFVEYTEGMAVSVEPVKKK